LSLGLSDGATGLLVMNTRAACYEVSVEVTATLGSIKMGDSAAASVRQDGREQRALSGDWFGRFTDAYQLEIEAWAGGLAVGVAVGPSAWDGYLATLAAEACMRSSETGTSIRVDPVARPAIYGPR
jgi:myo-inositol 2-dehydrogenase/D-chiro-inositol 1-dehydrogenase